MFSHKGLCATKIAMVAQKKLESEIAFVLCLWGHSDSCLLRNEGISISLISSSATSFPLHHPEIKLRAKIRKNGN